MPAMSSIAARNEASLAFDGLLKPLIFLTNWRDAARISSSVTGGSKLKRTLMLRHIALWLQGIRKAAIRICTCVGARCRLDYTYESCFELHRCLAMWSVPGSDSTTVYSPNRRR